MANDNGLVYRAQAGDEEAFAELMRVYYAYVYTIVIQIVNDPNDAEEVVQDTFLSAYRGLTQLEDRGKFKSWLAEIARNHARDRLRKQKVDTVSIDAVGVRTLQTPTTVDDELIRAEQRELIRRAMETLSEKDREIARSYYLDGASYDELIQTHGLSYKAISVRLSRAKQKLAKRLAHLLTAIFVPPATTLKQIYSGGLIAMKIGTAPKITVGAIGIITLLFVSVHQVILPKFFGSKNTVSSVQTEAPSELAETDANQETEEGKKQPQISDQDMAQINNFFAQFDDAGTQSDIGEARPSTESNTTLTTTDTDPALEDTQTADEQGRQQSRWTDLELRAERISQIEQELVALSAEYDEYFASFEEEARKITDQISEIISEIGVEAADKDPVVSELARHSLEINEGYHRIKRKMIPLVGEYLQWNGDYTRVADLTGGHIRVRPSTLTPDEIAEIRALHR